MRVARPHTTLLCVCNSLDVKRFFFCFLFDDQNDQSLVSIVKNIFDKKLSTGRCVDWFFRFKYTTPVSFLHFISSSHFLKFLFFILKMFKTDINLSIKMFLYPASLLCFSPSSPPSRYKLSFTLLLFYLLVRFNDNTTSRVVGIKAAVT